MVWNEMELWHRRSGEKDLSRVKRSSMGREKPEHLISFPNTTFKLCFTPSLLLYFFDRLRSLSSPVYLLLFLPRLLAMMQ